MRYRLIFMVIPALLCSACATMDTGSSPQTANSSEWRLQNLESRFLEYQEDNKKQQAEMDARLQTMENRLEKANRTAEAAQTLASKSNAETASLMEAMRAKNMQASTAEKKAVAAQTSSPAARAQPVATSPQRKKAVAAKRPAPIVSQAEVTYQKALNLVRSGNTTQGRKQLETFLQRNPGSPLVPNALYWLGESYYHEKRYAQAILTFKNVIRQHSKHNKAPASMLKIGFSYEMLKDISNAKFYLQALVEDYPSSAPASLARKKLASL